MSTATEPRIERSPARTWTRIKWPDGRRIAHKDKYPHTDLTCQYCGQIQSARWYYRQAGAGDGWYLCGACIDPALVVEYTLIVNGG